MLGSVITKFWSLNTFSRSGSSLLVNRITNISITLFLLSSPIVASSATPVNKQALIYSSLTILVNTYNSPPSPNTHTHTHTHTYTHTHTNTPLTCPSWQSSCHHHTVNTTNKQYCQRLHQIRRWYHYHHHHHHLYHHLRFQTVRINV